MSWRHREPRLEDMLADSIVKAVMADGVDPRELETIFHQIAAHLRTIKARSQSSEQSTKVELAVKLQTAKALG